MTRSTQDVDLLVNRADLPRIIDALAGVGFTHRHSSGLDMFLDGPVSVREGVHLVFAAEVIRPEHPRPSPPVVLDPDESAFPLTHLESLVLLKLNSNRRKDQVHLLDLIAVGLIDASWPARFEDPLDARLQALLDDPDGRNPHLVPTFPHERGSRWIRRRRGLHPPAAQALAAAGGRAAAVARGGGRADRPAVGGGARAR